MHPAEEIRGSKSKTLSKKRIVLGVTGSIAAVDCVKIARELIRHGAEVYPVMTPDATKIIHPYALEFATGNKPVVEITGKTEHVSFCGQIQQPVDMLLISPCTANTLSKIAHGVDDTAVTTFATTAIGSGVQILIAPAMHLSMYKHRILQENIDKCKRNGIRFVEPVLTKNKAKMPSTDEIVAHVIRNIGRQDLEDMRVLIIGGSTSEPVDDVRVVTNRSSGKTAVSLAKKAFYRGAEVEMWYGSSKEPVPGYIKTTFFESIKDVLKLLKNRVVKNFDVIIVCAALSDYIPVKHKGKIPSGQKKLVLEMLPAPRFISQLRGFAPDTKIVGFKVEDNKNKLKKKSFEFLKKNDVDMVVANTTSGFDSDVNEIWVINRKRKVIHERGTKDFLADVILDAVKTLM
ncbi:MAG: bifunctional phosphopantothenoylcysteine decarboxylase/phosphopantothenate--cysteine ligase CoaBC [Thermoplasmatota archaeon]|jgi:phosphopantothenoylcysteine decarboxylase/phosphopantothenate--cysteine ligase